MHLIRQPDGGSLCGQACVAMAAGVSLAAAIRAVGHDRRRGTHTWELVAAFGLLGVSCAPRLKRTRHVAGIPVLPPRAVVAIRRDGNKHRWHWLLWWMGEMRDPAGLWPEFYGSDWKITSFLQIHAPDKIAVYFPVRKNAAHFLLQQPNDVREKKATWQQDEGVSQWQPNRFCLTGLLRRPVSYSSAARSSADGAAAGLAAM